MEIPALIEKHLRHILAHTSNDTDQDACLQDFYKDIVAPQRFFPLPNQFRALKLINALNRMPDLKDAVRNRLEMEVKSLWSAYLPSQKDTAVSADGPPAASQDRHKPSPSSALNDVQSATANAQRKAAAPPIQMMAQRSGIQTGTPARRDWFDSLLDFVAACLSPLIS